MNQQTERMVRPRRSFIFSPGLRPDMFPKALACGTDIVCVELEDGIAPKDKAEARAKGLALFAEPHTGDGTGDGANDGVERIVRINCLREAFGLADVQAVLATDTPPPALMLPKVKSPDEIVWLDDLLTERGHPTRLHVIIETNAGLEAVHDIARASSRIDALFFGGVDMAAELRCQNAWEPLLYARSRIVHAAASQGIDAIDVPYLDLEDLAGMEREASMARDLGFSGKGSIHPKQIPILNAVFTPDEVQVAHARRILQAFADADTGLVVVDGKLIEKPVLREMNRILAIAERVSN
ncbi:MAG: CoA ester lyase [Rhodospirillaceae bacterium]|jgi:(S)-citramalyl-CoA lyase|nr:CoA ester lyase [Rhodospirillaceae bacterium]MBT4042485.1 CoA ester lyase [Rhodospirillaceae bacterium]MBT4687148.1 CoA ester lyase [Rhodospirillaceae bacterium]MBT5081338.1 CoA ester lyase [Rhodospirillaceae bacterium]MBT5522822.1 CoA ester lyase [Rhodospirillaceae bacterium]